MIDTEKQETGLQDSPGVAVILENEGLKEGRSSNPDQDTEDEEIVDEILNSDQEESNENILMKKQSIRARAGEAFNSESEK